MNNLISKIISKKEVPTGTIYGIYKKGRIIKKYQGPKKAKFHVNSYDLNLNIIGKTRDGQRVIGNCILKYDLNLPDYLKSLNKCEESVEELGEKLSKEISYDLSGVISEYNSKNLGNDDTKRCLEAEIEKRSKITLLKKGINPYKITSKWEIFSEFSWVGDCLEDFLSKLDKETSNLNINEFLENLEKDAKKLEDDILAYTNYNSRLRAKTLGRMMRTVARLSSLNPGMKPSKYLMNKKGNKIINEAKSNGLKLLVDYDV